MNLYFAGSSLSESSDWLVQENCNRLFSWVVNKSELDRMVKLKRDGDYSGKLLIDSGAFTAHRQGTEVDVESYIKLLNDYTDCAEAYAQVDTIPGQFGKPKTLEDKMKAPKLSWENYLYMRPQMKEPDKLMPIYHQGEDIKWLHNMLSATFEGSHVAYIGISPANDQPQAAKNDFIAECFNVIKHSSNPKVMTHAYGMTNLRVLETFPFTSADSTSWVLNAVNGSIMYNYRAIGMSEKSKISGHFRGQPPAIQQRMEEGFKQRGFSASELETNYRERIRWNIYYLKRWAENYQYKPVHNRRRSLV